MLINLPYRKISILVKKIVRRLLQVNSCYNLISIVQEKAKLT